MLLLLLPSTLHPAASCLCSRLKIKPLILFSRDYSIGYASDVWITFDEWWMCNVWWMYDAWCMNWERYWRFSPVATAVCWVPVKTRSAFQWGGTTFARTAWRVPFPEMINYKRPISWISSYMMVNDPVWRIGIYRGSLRSHIPLDYKLFDDLD